MTKYITATVIVERLVEENRSLFVQGERLALLMKHLSACDRETVVLEREISHLEAENEKLRLQIQQRDIETYRLRAVAQLLRESLERGGQMQSALALDVPAQTTPAFNGFPDNQETARKALDDLISRALAYRTGPELKALFVFMKRFPHLAPYNAMLLHVQNPEIQFALRAPVWERKYERRV
jgi:hypothetical protein